MRRRLFLAGLATLLVLDSGCVAQINQTMQSWVGSSVSNLIASWGPPKQIIDDGSGGKIYVWAQTHSFTTPGQATTTTTGQATAYGNQVYGTAQSATTYNPPQTTQYTSDRMFWVNSNGTVYHWAWHGL